MTTPTRIGRTLPRQGIVGEVVRGIAAILVLLVLIAGIPVALLLLGHALPIHVTATSVRQVLTQPDDGSLFLLALLSVAWIGWAAFAFSALLEIVARVRGIPAPTLPAISLTQRGAASLIATAAVLLTPTTHWTPTAAASSLTTSIVTTHSGPGIIATTRHAAPASVSSSTTTVARDVSAEVGAGGHPQQASTPRFPTVTVHRYDTFWGLAERYLGAGIRYPEIVALNRGRPQPDGGTVRDADTLLPGWVLRLPTDARHLPTPTLATVSPAPGRENPDTTPTTTGEQRTYLVRSGDTLWDIAEDNLGDPLRFSQIFRLNRGLPQPGGATLLDPRLILPGWRLLLPPQAATGAAKAVTSHVLNSPAAPGRVSTHGLPRVSEQPHSPAPLPPSAPHRVNASPSGGGIPAADGPTGPPTAPPIPPAPIRAVAQPPHPRLDRQSHDPDDPSSSSGELVLGMSALAATGLIAELARRRRRQQAHRGFGDRIPMPPRPVARTEATLKSTVTPITVDSVRRALRQLASTCGQAGRALPELRLLLIGPDTVQAHLDRPEPDGIAPFTALDATHWQLDLDQITSDADSIDVAEPYPALLTLGVSEAHQVVLNLDAVGTLTITGQDQDAGDAVLRAVAVDLGIGPMCATALPTFVACFPDLAGALDPSRVRHTADPARAERALTARLGPAPTGAPDVEVEPTSILLSPVPLTVRAAPHSGAAVIHTGPEGDATTILRITGPNSAVLEPGQLRLAPQRLSEQDYQHVVEMLAIADRPSYGPSTAQSDPGGNESGNASIADVDVSALTNVVAAAPITTPVEPREIPEPTPLPPAHTSPARAESGPPRVLLLGTVSIQGTGKGSTPGRQRKLTELIAYLALHPQASGNQIDEALWPGRRVPRNTRSTTVYRARQWLGTDATTGESYLPQLRDHELTYHLHKDITTDWEQFQELARRGLRAATGTSGLADLDAALALVRGRPFLGIDPAGYIWAEPLIQTMIATIADVAHLAAATHLEAGNPRAALRAALTGVDVDEASELLLADAEHAATLAGDQHALAKLQQRCQDDDE